MTVGILMEKPSAARNGSKAWGGTKGTFDGEQYVIAHARGHLYEFVAPDKMVDPSLAGKYKNWDLTNLPWDLRDFSWANEPIKDTAQVRNNVKQALSGCEEIAIATDWDESGEGDAIAINALVELGLTGKKISRLHFTDESEKSLQQAFKDRRPVQSVYEHPAFKKARFRSMFDFASMQWSRAATIMARQSGQDTVLRQGRLKSAMVKLVGDQLKAYNDYVKQPFFQNRFRDENAVVYTNPDEPRFDRADQVPQEYTASPVIRDSVEMRRTAPPKLLDLAALSSMLVNKGVKAQLTLKTYQAMYEQQVVSYPRTEDKTITPQQHAELAPLADRIAAVAGVDTKHLTHREPRKTHVKPVGAHGANRPGPNVPSSSMTSSSVSGPSAASSIKRWRRTIWPCLPLTTSTNSTRATSRSTPTSKASPTCRRRWAGSWSSTPTPGTRIRPATRTSPLMAWAPAPSRTCTRARTSARSTRA